MENKAISQDLLICPACGTQFDQPASNPLPSCRICDDPRQYIPPTGQRWTSLRQELGKAGSEAHENHIVPLTVNINSDSTLSSPTLAKSDGQVSTTREVPDAYTIYTKPTLGIGERAILLITPHGTIMWDLITYLDDATIARLNAPPFNGLKAIVISHPHYYTTHLDWAEAFGCPVYISEEDEGWTSREDVHGRRSLIKGATEEIVPGVTAVKVGGHFPGSLVLHWKEMLLIADSIVTMPVSCFFPPSNAASHTDKSELVCPLSHQSATRHHFVQLYVVHPQHDPPPSLHPRPNVGSSPTVRVHPNAWGVRGTGRI